MGDSATVVPTALCKVSCYKSDLKELTVLYIYLKKGGGTPNFVFSSLAPLYLVVIDTHH